MAIEIATAFVQIVPSMKGVGKAIESAFGSASETAGNTAGIKAGNGFAGGFGAKLGVITGIAQSVAGKASEAFMGLSGEITSASDSAQKFASTLNFAGVSEQQIKRLPASPQDYADKTVYDLNDIRNTTAQLAANGVPNYDKLAEAAGNLNAVAGGSADTFKSVAMVLTQTAGQGKLTTENWNQLSDAIPGASGKIQQALKEAGAYTGNFRDAMADGQITAQEFNDAIMSLGFTDAAPLFSDGDEAMVRAAEIPETDAVSLAKYTAQRLGTTVALADGGNRIKKVAFCGGAGVDFIGATIEAGCDAFITGELKHNEFIESKERGYTVIEAGHFATENPVVEALAARLREEIENEIIVIGQEAPEKYIK